MIDYRAVSRTEHQTAIEHWSVGFLGGEDQAFFQRYYEVDPSNIEGDTLGAWDGDRLASAVHICRRTLMLDGKPLLLGAIANVATLPEYRGQGISGALLQQAIERMERGGFAFSTLYTGVPTHYSKYGWESKDLPKATVTLKPEDDSQGGYAEGSLQQYMNCWSRSGRPLQLVRPPVYFENWAAWTDKIILIGETGWGAVLRSDRENSDAVALDEWCVPDAESEGHALRAAAEYARSFGRGTIQLAGVPQFGGTSALEPLGTVESTTGSFMIRGVNATNEEYERIVDLYVSGESVFWPGDAF